MNSLKRGEMWFLAVVRMYVYVRVYPIFNFWNLDNS